MTAFDRFMGSTSGQTACVIVFIVAVVAFIGIVIFEEKWG